MRIDYHVHTNFSDGANTVGQIMEKAVRLGISELAITDHYDPFDPGLSYMDQTPGALREHFASIRRCAAGKPLQVYCGIETSTGMDGRLRLPAEVLRLCDIVITSVHYLDYGGPVRKGEYENDGYWSAYKKKLLAMAAGGGDVLGHPEAYLPMKRMLEDGSTFEQRLDICARVSRKYFDEAFIEALGDALVASGKAYELHGASGTPREWVVRRLHEKGVTFSIGSDAHAVDWLGRNERAIRLWKELGLHIRRPFGNTTGPFPAGNGYTSRVEGEGSI